jgi:hypothetical protein
MDDLDPESARHHLDREGTFGDAAGKDVRASAGCSGQARGGC